MPQKELRNLSDEDFLWLIDKEFVELTFFTEDEGLLTVDGYVNHTFDDGVFLRTSTVGVEYVVPLDDIRKAKLIPTKVRGEHGGTK